MAILWMLFVSCFLMMSSMPLAQAESVAATRGSLRRAPAAATEGMPTDDDHAILLQDSFLTEEPAVDTPAAVATQQLRGSPSSKAV